MRSMMNGLMKVTEHNNDCTQKEVADFMVPSSVGKPFKDAPGTFDPKMHGRVRDTMMGGMMVKDRTEMKKAGAPHTVANKLMGKCGSVRVRLIPAPRGTGLVAAPASKKLLSMAGLEDCYTSSRGHTRTMGNFIKATFFAISKSYGYLSPELWKETVFQPPPFQEHTDFLKIEKKAADSPAY